MKNMKRILALALALIMVLSLSITVIADGENTPVNGPFNVTITNANGHTYQIYQIFTGDLSTKTTTVDGKPVTEEVLSNIVFGTDYLPSNGKTSESGDQLYYAVGEEVPQTVLEDVKEAINTKPITFAPTGDGAAMTNDTANGTATATGLVAGYYMIKDVTENLPEGETLSAVIFQVVGDTNIASKHNGTIIEKKVQDINDSTGMMPTYEKDANGKYIEITADPEDERTWIDSADYDIGDIVPFKSTAKFEGLDQYTTYKVEFTDIMAKGLTYNGDMQVLVNGDNYTSAFTITPVTPYTPTADEDSTDAYKDGTKISVSCDNIKAIEGLTVGNNVEIILVYSATLNNNANFGAPGNPNKIRVKSYPNGEGQPETPWDVNIVFTYKVEANKYANEVKAGNELTGAGFTLYKWVITTTEGENGATSATAGWVQIDDEVKGEEMTKFEWKGLDDGKYKLEETTTPTGYNTIDPIEFEVVAEHVIVADNPTLTNLTGETETGEIEFKAEATSGLVSTDVVNKSGVVLPETGGMGTKLFYIIGGVLVAGAVVLLVTKKRMSTIA